MKYLVGLYLVLFFQAALATECRLDGAGEWVDVRTRNIFVDATLQVQPGGRVIAAGYNLECRHRFEWGLPGNAEDYVETQTGAFSPLPIIIEYTNGLVIHGNEYVSPVTPWVRIANLRAAPNSNIQNLNTYVFFKTTPAPSGGYLHIRPSAFLGTIKLWVINNAGLSSRPAFYFNVYVFAKNEFNLSPLTCTINNNQPMTIDFGPVAPLAIGQSPVGSSIEKFQTLYYSCPNAGINSLITISLRGPAAVFNSNLLGTNNPKLGVGLFRGTTLVAPNGVFTTSISNSIGSDSVMFKLVREPGSFPAAGDFSGNATLVLGVP